MTTVESTNRRWQNHLRAKGLIPFFLDRLQQHALASTWQSPKGPFSFPIDDPEQDDELARTYFDFIEEFPYEFYVELTNHCNLRCVMCARSAMERPLGVMAMPLYRRIINEIAEKQPYAFIHYYGIGESMIDKRIFDKLAYSVSKGLHNGLLFTNGQLLLNKENYKRLADSGISNIGVDLDGFSAATYERIRIGGNFEKTRRGIEKLYGYVREHGLRTRVEIAYQIVPGTNEAEVGPFVAWCNENRYEYKLVTMHDWAGLRSDVGSSEVAGTHAMHHTRRTTPCAFLWNGFTIAWDGRVAVCFHDAALRETLGDLRRESIQSVWRGRARARRRDHVQGRIEGICASCECGTGIELPPFHSQRYPKCLRDEASAQSMKNGT